MVRRQAKNWGLRAAAFAAIVVWQIYELASASVFSPNEGSLLHYLVVGIALFGLIASLVKMSADE